VLVTQVLVMSLVDGDRLAKSTPIDVLLRQDFRVVINDLQYTVTSPAGAGTYVNYTGRLHSLT